MSTAHDLPLAVGEPAGLPPAPLLAGLPVLRLLPAVPVWEEHDFEAAVRALRPRLHRYATRRLGDAHEAEELVQEALLRAYAARDRLATEEDLAAWTTVVTGRLVIDRLRVRHRSVSVAEVPETSRTGRDTAEVAVGREEARMALDALDAMPSRQAALLWAREVEGESYDALCVRFGMTEPAVRSTLTRARKALRKEYATRGGTLPVAGLAVIAPWLAGLGWAERLRDVAHRVSAPAALATVGITALGSLVLAPFATGDRLEPAPFTSKPAVIGAAVTTAARPAGDLPGAAPARAAASGGSVTRPAAEPPTRSRKLIDTVTVPCGKGAPVQSAACGPKKKGAFIHVGPPLPDNPVLHDTVGVTVSAYDCTGWKANPVIACTPGGADR